MTQTRPLLPRSLPACLPILWSEVLFPSARPVSSRLRRTALCLLVVLPGLLLYPCLGFHLFEPDEGRYAEIPREMLVRGEWVVPYLQGQPYLDKPPLLYWLVIVSYRLLGVHDWSARLVPALAVHATILLTYLLGRRSLGERAAFWGALLLAVAPAFVSVGRLLVLDGLLTLWATLSLLAAFEAVRTSVFRPRWWLLGALAAGLGVLTKGPVALVLVLPPVLAYRWLCVRRELGGSGTADAGGDGKDRATAARGEGGGRRALLLFVAIALAVPLPWYRAICLRAPDFARYFFWEHHVVRFLSPFDHLEPVWFYGPIVLFGLLPGTLLLVPFVRFLLSGEAEVCARRRPALGFFLLAGLWCVFFFSLSGCKLPTYILPAFPPLALALGSYLSESRWLVSRWPTAMAESAFALLLLAHYVGVPEYAEHRSPARNGAVLERYCVDPEVPVICYPRPCDSVAFYLGREDFLNFRSKQTPELIRFVQQQPVAVILFTHRHSLEALRPVLPPGLRLGDETPLCGSARPGPEGLLHLAVVRRVAPQPAASPSQNDGGADSSGAARRRGGPVCRPCG
jgi:hypothetical protein